MKRSMFFLNLKGITALAVFVIQFLVIATQPAFSQGVAINSSGTNPDASAGLDVNFTDRGMLVPRMTQAQRDAIASPATSLLIFQTDNGAGYYYYNGSSWNVLLTSSSGTAWSVSGNTGTNPSINFIGTADAKDLVFRTNDTEWMRILSSGGVGLRTDVTDGSKTVLRVINDNDDTKLIIRSDGHIGINDNDASSGIIDCTANGSDEGFRLTNDGANNSIRLWLAASDNTSGKDGIAYLSRGGQANTGICIDDNNEADHYGAVGICLDDDGSSHNATEPPNSTLQVNGSFSVRVHEISADYLLTNRDYFVKVITGGTDKTMTLPPASSCAGRIYIIKKIDAAAGGVIIDPDGSETIDGDSTYTFSDQYSSVSVISDGSSWFITNQ